jgi:hypothetical protein
VLGNCHIDFFFWLLLDWFNIDIDIERRHFINHKEKKKYDFMASQTAVQNRPKPTPRPTYLPTARLVCEPLAYPLPTTCAGGLAGRMKCVQL